MSKLPLEGVDAKDALSLFTRAASALKKLAPLELDLRDYLHAVSSLRKFAEETFSRFPLWPHPLNRIRNCRCFPIEPLVFGGCPFLFAKGDGGKMIVLKLKEGEKNRLVPEEAIFLSSPFSYRTNNVVLFDLDGEIGLSGYLRDPFALEREFARKNILQNAELQETVKALLPFWVLEECPFFDLGFSARRS